MLKFIAVDDSQRQRIGFTQETVTDLEADITTVTVTVAKTGGSPEHPTCYSYSEYEIQGVPKKQTCRLNCLFSKVTHHIISKL